MIKAFLFDLDGVFYQDNQLLPGANETLDWLRQKKVPYRFVTNNTTLPRQKLTEKLNQMGLQLKASDLVSANYAGLLYLRQQGYKKCRLVLREGAQADYCDFDTTAAQPEAIVIGDIGADWDYALMNELMNQVLKGAQLVALHKGRYFQTQQGLTLDSGAFVAGLEHATQTAAVVVGKPQATFFELATQDLPFAPHQMAMVGDDLINDIGGAQKIGYTTFLVKTGKYRERLFKASAIRPDHLIDNIMKLKQFIK